MNAERYIQWSLNLLTFSAVLVLALFFSFLRARAGDAVLLGVTVPHRMVHAVLGPILIVVNAAVLIVFLAVWMLDPTGEEIEAAQGVSKFGILGPLLNPVWSSGNAAISSIGYASLIILWWLGMHAFTYSIGLTPDASELVRAWQLVISGVYLLLGLASLIVIHQIWRKWGYGAYEAKALVGFAGIVLGAFVPPFFLDLGQPTIPGVTD